MDFLWDLRQSHEIDRAKTTAENSQRRTERLEGDLEMLEERLNRLALANLALWSLLKEISDLTDEDLTRRLEEIDLSDGKLDGRVRGGLMQCPRCDRTLSQRHRHCLYCGYKAEGENAFDEVAR